MVVVSSELSFGSTLQLLVATQASWHHGLQEQNTQAQAASAVGSQFLIPLEVPFGTCLAPLLLGKAMNLDHQAAHVLIPFVMSNVRLCPANILCGSNPEEGSSPMYLGNFEKFLYFMASSHGKMNCSPLMLRLTSKILCLCTGLQQMFHSSARRGYIFTSIVQTLPGVWLLLQRTIPGEDKQKLSLRNGSTSFPWDIKKRPTQVFIVLEKISKICHIHLMDYCLPIKRCSLTSEHV